MKSSQCSISAVATTMNIDDISYDPKHNSTLSSYCPYLRLQQHFTE